MEEFKLWPIFWDDWLLGAWRAKLVELVSADASWYQQVREKLAGDPDLKIDVIEIFEALLDAMPDEFRAQKSKYPPYKGDTEYKYSNYYLLENTFMIAEELECKVFIDKKKYKLGTVRERKIRLLAWYNDLVKDVNTSTKKTEAEIIISGSVGRHKFSLERCRKVGGKSLVRLSSAFGLMTIENNPGYIKMAIANKKLEIVLQHWGSKIESEFAITPEISSAIREWIKMIPETE